MANLGQFDESSSLILLDIDVESLTLNHQRFRRQLILVASKLERAIITRLCVVYFDS